MRSSAPVPPPRSRSEAMTQPELGAAKDAASRQHTVARLLEEVSAGRREALDALLPLVYEELRALARRQRRRWRGDETLGTTALIHEAYLRLVDQTAPQWSSHPHFLAVASRAMRQVLLDYAKRQHAAKRGGARRQLSLGEVEEILLARVELDDPHSDALLALESALSRLEQHDQLHARIVECRFYGGMSVEETAVALGTSPATVKRKWAFARAYLNRELTQ